MKRIVMLLIVIFFTANISACSFKIGPSSTNKVYSTNEPYNATKSLPDIETTPKNSDQSTTKGEQLSLLVPEGWKLLQQARGDLNKDGLEDVAAVVEATGKKESVPSRALLIWLREKDGSLKLAVQSEHAILKADEGGVWGDPFDNIAIERGSVLLSFYGGSNWRWTKSYRFRHQNNGWDLIGATESSGHTSTRVGTIEEDYNLLTGIYIKKETGEDEITKTEKINRGKKALVNLKDFDIRSEKKQF